MCEKQGSPPLVPWVIPSLQRCNKEEDRQWLNLIDFYDSTHGDYWINNGNIGQTLSCLFAIRTVCNDARTHRHSLNKPPLPSEKKSTLPSNVFPK